MQGTRPGGLTALGVISIIWSAISFFGVLGTVILISVGNFMPKPAEGASAEEVEKLEKVRAQMDLFLEWDWLVAHTILSALCVVMLFIAAIGYFKMKRVLGRYMGNAYALLSLFLVALSSFSAPKMSGSDFGLILGLVLPVLTLLLVNVTFKDDLIR